KSDLAIANACQLIVRHAGNVASIEFVASGTRRIEAAEHIHQGRLAAATRSHDGEVFVAANLQGHAAQRTNNLFAHHVIFRDALDVYDRLRRSSVIRHFAASLSYAIFAPSFSLRLIAL